MQGSSAPHLPAQLAGRPLPRQPGLAVLAPPSDLVWWQRHCQVGSQHLYPQAVAPAAQRALRGVPVGRQAGAGLACFKAKPAQQ